MSNSLDPIPYPDAQIRGILQRVRTIAMVGASANWNRPSYFVMKYLQGEGLPGDPGEPRPRRPDAAGRDGLCAACATFPITVDMVDVFRAVRRGAGPIVDDAIAIGAKVVWMQLGVRNDAAAARPRRPGSK